MKTFPLTNKQKQMIFVATGFLYQFLEEKEKHLYKNEWKLLITLSKLSVTIRDDLAKELEYAYKQLEKLTEGKDIEVNAVAFAINLAFVFAETADIDEPIKNKIFSLGNKIFKGIEKQLKGAEELRNANELSARFTRNLF